MSAATGSGPAPVPKRYYADRGRMRRQGAKVTVGYYYRIRRLILSLDQNRVTGGGINSHGSDHAVGSADPGNDQLDLVGAGGGKGWILNAVAAYLPGAPGSRYQIQLEFDKNTPVEESITVSVRGTGPTESDR